MFWSRYKESLPEEPKKQRCPQAATASKRRNASLSVFLNVCVVLHGLTILTDVMFCKWPRSRAGWLSKERSTPEGLNLEQHADMFKFPFPELPIRDDDSSSDSDWEIPVIRQRKPLEVRNACRERAAALRQKAALHHAEVALCKYNRANNTKFEVVEVRVISIFFEFGGGCIHYNFTAKQPEGHLSADADITKLLFSEVDLAFQNENDVLLCCIVGENDAGHCYGCEDYKPVVHPSSQAYGGGSTTCIELPGSDGDSTDSD
ncbi:unnamed protein product [Alopecurus aequalis]